MSDAQPTNGNRLDRIENAIAHLLETQANQEIRLGRFVEALERIEHNQQQLLTAQVLLTDAQRKAEEKIGTLADFQTRLADFQTRLADFQTRLADSQAQLTESQARLADSQAELSESQQRLEATYQRLVEMQQHTDERLNALIQIVDEIIRRRPPESA